MISVHLYHTKKLSIDSSYFVDVVMRTKFRKSKISLRVTITTLVL